MASKKGKIARIRKSVLKSTVLEVLNALGEASIEIIDQGFLNPKYAFTHPTRELLGLNKKYKYYSAEERKNLFAVVVSRLQKEGLIEKLTTKKGMLWKINSKGLSFLENHDGLYKLPPKDGKTRIFSFDVPEKERWKRDRLRTILVSCGYEMLQQSLWMGESPMPAKVFDELKSLNLMSKIHFFEVSKKGTLKQINI
ncbi:MAG: hypothetical protein HYY55_04140 [Candidatus Niyogibacteria bacterium]|nr:MAG: hypothetical protein HYY55_04140 [Candidatus Niyogibacteria bacterium]